MDIPRRHYPREIEREDITLPEIKKLEYLLPEWITNLKTYFEREPGKEYSSSCSQTSHDPQ